MNDTDIIQQFRDHVEAGKSDVNTADLIQKARNILRPMGNTKEADELSELIQRMVNLPPERRDTWPGSTARML